MSMQGNIAIEGYIEDLEKFIEANKDKSPEEILDLIKKKIAEDKKTAKQGWY